MKHSGNPRGWNGEKFCGECRSELKPVDNYIRWGYDEMTGKRIYHKSTHMICPRWGEDNKWWNLLYRRYWDEHTNREVSFNRVKQPPKDVRIYAYGEDY